MKIQSKILMSFMAMVAIIIALIVFAFLSLHIMDEANLQLIYVQKKAGLVSDLQVTIDRAVTALGGYLLSGEKAQRSTFIQLVLFSKRQVSVLEESSYKIPPGTLPGMDMERRKVKELKAEMEAIDTDARELLSLADKIEREQGQKVVRDMVEMARGVLDKKRAGGEGAQPAGDLRALEEILGVNTGDVQKRLQEIERLSMTISASEARLRELSMQIVRSKDKALEKIGELRELARRQGILAVTLANAADQRAKKYALVGAVMTLTCGLVLAFSLSRSFSRPIRELDRGVRMIGDGNFDHRLQIDTGDEIEELAAQFNAMSGKLKEFYRELEERVRERTRELEVSGQQLRRLFNGITDGISMIDGEYTILNANAGIASLVGKAAEEVIGRTCYRSYSGSDSPCPGCPAVETFKKGIPSSAQLRWCAPGQRAKEMQIYIFPLLEEEGKVRRVIEYAKDVSEKKALEQKLFQSAKLAAIGTLAAGVAHEIRNPLGIMKTSADMIKRNSREGEQNHELAEFMMEEVDRLNRVVTQLLDFARPSTPNIEPCGMNSIFDRALALVGPQHRIQDIHIVRNYAAVLPPLAADREQLCQVFLNLIINAVQAMDGSGSLTLATGKGEGETVWASVSDTGKGIDTEVLSTIFDPFFTTKEKGSGLGLTIAYRIVETHRGRLDVKSAPGKGTTVTVVIPAA
ncbi:MAG: ATP-binding protein [Candidatus Aureabacteria bacterium]|nr:ATP-binding protein [Candidatus Auribacterota bacterium]